VDRSKPVMADSSETGPSPADPDAPFVEQARGGDATAFRTLVERHHARAFALAWRLTGDRADAEEVAQDAFVRAWRALPAFRAEAAFGTWLHRIVTRVALDRRARLAARRGREVGVGDADLEAAAAGVSGGGDGGDRVTARARAALLAGLSEAQRTAVSLHYLEDRPVLEVAQAMGLPENTVKTHLARARAAMREAFLRGEARSRGAIEA
jgi:RNA polymerase sigma-70 factor (ECF subfamily)